MKADKDVYQALNNKIKFLKQETSGVTPGETPGSRINTE
jgi:hypothetical protein